MNTLFQDELQMSKQTSQRSYNGRKGGGNTKLFWSNRFAITGAGQRSTVPTRGSNTKVEKFIMQVK